jgi:hypothetical protein
VTDVSWSRCAGTDCIRLRGVGPGVDVRVHPGEPLALEGLPAMAGRLVADGGDACFVPRFAFLEGTAYAVTVGGDVAAVLVRPRSARAATTEVVAIQPTAASVPRNLLRLYVWFSAPMAEGQAAQRIRLVDDAGTEMAGALLPNRHELWDPDRRRLTVLLDPARIKRGLVAHEELGYPLRTGAAFRVVVDAGYEDAAGAVLRAGAERRYEVGGDERRRVDPARWTIAVPGAATDEGVEVGFDRPLDHGLLARCLRVAGADGRSVPGEAEIGPEGRSWRLRPDDPWSAREHRIVVDPVLEDLAGNSVSRVFDRDLGEPADDPANQPAHDPGVARPVQLTFRPR